MRRIAKPGLVMARASRNWAESRSFRLVVDFAERRRRRRGRVASSCPAAGATRKSFFVSRTNSVARRRRASRNHLLAREVLSACEEPHRNLFSGRRISLANCCFQRDKKSHSSTEFNWNFNSRGSWSSLVSLKSLKSTFEQGRQGQDSVQRSHRAESIGANCKSEGELLKLKLIHQLTQEPSRC